MTPLEGLLSTLACYVLAQGLYRLSGSAPWLQPVISGIALMVVLLVTTDTPYPSYFEAAQAIHVLLGTATVALAIPLYESRARIIRHWRPIVLTLLVTGLVAILSATGLAWLLGLPRELLITLAPKSVTTPFAIALTESLGGLPPLAAGLVILTGMLVALAGPPLARALHADSPLRFGLAMGMSGHGIATARAFEFNTEAGAFSALAMGLMGLYTSLILPWIFG